jgi:hypothetical protein
VQAAHGDKSSKVELLKLQPPEWFFLFNRLYGAEKSVTYGLNQNPLNDPGKQPRMQPLWRPLADAGPCK